VRHELAKHAFADLNDLSEILDAIERTRGEDSEKRAPA
jgi:hypothetical protein